MPRIRHSIDQKDDFAMGDTAAPLTLNQKVLEYARGQVEKQVGRGECWDLAEEAVTKSGGESSTTLTGVKGQKAFEQADYKWGDEVKLDDAQPGDVLQFKGHEFTEKTITGNKLSTDKYKRGHHTAIVEKN